ncbi:uncharacterized protein PGTG_03038 [Puccinia graminis f. sp. tritici CRL 75-36-700-3]|uniref:Tet-like 2OG-Fe(II) oxygenase domain-containing protein n=1 Tax=Puccinia graminis f. sp. tritici (strain CRL 75-36-700-3 / race SCCL) TaxID=418459 RepID=E3JYF7_PUCGT|nr:uncharacterized protein PGTG_03038 [Puccinia graminis f. sp. tritici CRL 75-36-700-3]EFP77082.2 hypothetical protein PGTG_03038 [Puccinia graminis f. sp. tritici CRL 75-36-700-3]
MQHNNQASSSARERHPNSQIPLPQSNYAKHESGATRDSRRRKLKKQKVRPEKRKAGNLEYTNERNIAAHVSRGNKDRPIHKFKNSFVCYSNNARTKAVAVVKFYPFEGMDPERKAHYERLSTNLIAHTRFQNANKSNENTLGGTMYSLGWRKGYEGKSHLGITGIASKVAKDQEGWIKLFMETPWINDFLAQRFRDISLGMCREVKEQHDQQKAPSLTPFYMADPESFCGHLSFTFNNFYNKAHKDEDGSPFRFAMWIPINKQTGKLVEENLQVEGGEFVFPEDGCAIDFSGFNGVVECVWKASEHPHHTLPSSTAIGSSDDRLGLSCLLPDSAERAIERMMAVEDGEKLDWTIQDLGHLHNDSLKYDSKGKPFETNDGVDLQASPPSACVLDEDSSTEPDKSLSSQLKVATPTQLHRST